MVVALKTTIVLTIMAIAMGVLAGLLVVTFDFTPYGTGLLVLFVILAILNEVPIYVA